MPRNMPPHPVRLADYRPPDHLVSEIALDIHLDARETRVAARLHVSPNPSSLPGQPLILDRDGIEPERILLDGRPLSSSDVVIESDRLTIAGAPERPFVLETLTVIDPEANSALSGLYRSDGVFCTQCEAEGFRRITPYPDRPDVLARYETRIEAVKEEARFLLSNGNPVGHGDLPGGLHYALWRDPWPKPSYLFALVGGNLAVIRDRFVTRSGRDVALEIYVEDGKQERCYWAMESLKQAMRWDEEAFGREYDLDLFMIVAVSSFNMGAMENKGLNIFNDKYILASPDTATDLDFTNIEAVIAHEYFHNWTGNRITCRDWFQLCLKEGLTVFRDHEFTSDVRSRAVKRIADVRNLRLHQFVEDAGPLAHPVRPDTYQEINNFYTATVYEKGAEVIRMLKVLLGDALFRAGMDLYFERHDGTATTIEAFIACFAEAAGRDLSQFMRWYTQAGTPEVVAEGAYDAAKRTYSLTLHQSVPATPGQPTKEPMVIPIALGLLGADGRDLPLETVEGPLPGGLIELAAPRLQLTFTNLPAKPIPSLLRGFSAPVRLSADLGTSDLLFLLTHDGDPFNRWQAGQTSMMAHMVAAYGRQNAPAPEADAIAAALGRVLRDRNLDEAFTAQAITAPTESDVARELAHGVDPDAVHAARQSLRHKLARKLRDALLERYRPLAEPVSYAPDAASTGRRALKNAILDLLCAGDATDGPVLAAAQFEASDNMTDRLGALTALSQQPGAARETMLGAFYARHEGDALAIDKWFSLQATIMEPETLDRVKHLSQHAAFSMTNPNRMRALIGAFAASNPTEFNRADGAGFAYVADVVLLLDVRNPQVAARLLTAFRSWRALEPRRRAQAEIALRRIAAAPNLSRDSDDIVRRMLQADAAPCE